MSRVAGADPLLEIIAEHQAGAPRGIASVCSAHPAVLRAAACHAAAIGAPLLVESTSNQVNQHGGYSGMTPAGFAASLHGVAADAGLPSARVLLGGDHLGPYPWRAHPAAEAMRQADELVRACVHAGYTKLHLDASMRCADDEGTAPSHEVIAERTADLCAAAEDAWRTRPAADGVPVYVIGSDVPAPGGETGDDGGPAVTAPDAVTWTLDVTRRAFIRRGLAAAWERVIALVVQPGVDFGGDRVWEYDHDAAAPLSRAIAAQPRVVYEAHSTDYQQPDALRRMVEDHFAILKVGPALTFAYREAVFALAWMEREWLGGGAELSDVPAAVDRAMAAEPREWAGYYHGAEDEVACARRYGYADRVRYYWNVPEVQAALARLFRNLNGANGTRLPLSLLSQFMPVQYARVREHRLRRDPAAWIADHITDALRPYTAACRMETGA
jgi:D-tagatose-1,6-bisphosphate aldolase subunit GatZ/KbaZ